MRYSYVQFSPKAYNSERLRVSERMAVYEAFAEVRAHALDNNPRKETNVNEGSGILVIGGVVVGIIGGLMWGLPTYNVWTSSLSGKAELQKAEYTRQVAALDAQAEVARAQGVAQANKIVAEGLGGPEGYLRYLWIEKVAGSSNQIVYVPSDGGLPVLEAGRLKAPAVQ